MKAFAFPFPFDLRKLFGTAAQPQPQPPPPAHDPLQAAPGQAPMGPVGGPRDLAYAAPYADALNDLQAVMIQLTGDEVDAPAPATIPAAPKKMEAPAKPKGPGETHPFDFKSSPGAGQPGTETRAGMDKRGNVIVGTQRTTEVDDKGKVKNGDSASGGFGRDGFNGSVSRTKDGKASTASMKVDPFSDETAVKVSHRDVSVSASHKGDTSTIGGSGKAGPVSAKASVSVTDGVKRGEIGREGIDATIHDFVGDGHYTELDRGHAVTGGVDVDNGVLGAGASGTKGSLTKRRHFSSGEEKEHHQEDQMLYRMFPMLAPRDTLFASVADIDIDRLEPGEGYSIEESKQVGGEAHVKCLLSASLGKDEAEMSQTVLARDAKGDIRVMVAQGDEDTLTGSVSAGKAVSVAGKESKANSSSVSFTAHGPDGVKAVKTFQRTGLLPGAERIAKVDDPNATEKFNSIKQEWEASVKAASYVGGTTAIMLQERIDTLREQMHEAAGPMNDAFLRHTGGSLDDTSVPGVRYDAHTVSKEHAKERSLSVGGHTIGKSGSKETEHERGYRAEKGEAHLELGAQTEDTYLRTKDEISTLALDPKDYRKDGDPVAMVVGGMTAMDQHQRDTMAKLGPEAFGMPKETLEAWRDGSLHESELDNMSITMTEGQLNKIRDELAIPNQMGMMTNGVGAYYEQVRSGATKETQRKAAGGGGRDGDEDAQRDVKRAVELNGLYATAASARARQVLGMAPGGPDSEFLQTFGMKQMLNAVDHVKTPADFLKLTPEEQKLVVATGAMAMREIGHQSSFECLSLVLQVKDKDQRNNLIRQLFQDNERQKKGSDNAVDFVQWLQNSGEAKHIPKEEMAEILSGVTVRSDDADTRRETKIHDDYEMIHPGWGNAIVGKKLADSVAFKIGGTKLDEDVTEHAQQRREERDADQITDLLQAARGEHADSRAVEQAMAAAVKDDPEFAAKMWEVLEEDPARAAWANRLLEGTRFHRQPPKK